MPELLSLDIHSPLDDRPRVVDIFGASVRIGRGPQCEVRLQDAALAEVECLLRRRGTTWYVLPQGMLGNLAIDGRSVEAMMPLGLGMVLRVGEHRLLLRRTQLGPRDVGSFEVPIEVGPRTATNERPEARQRESVERWQSQLAHRDRWLQARREERRWQAKWKAAGQNLPPRPAAEPEVVESVHVEPTIVPVPWVEAPPPEPAPGPPVVADEIVEPPPATVAEAPVEPLPAVVAEEQTIQPPAPELAEAPAAEEIRAIEAPAPIEVMTAEEAVPEPVLKTEPSPPPPVEVDETAPAWFVGTHNPFVTDTSQAPRALEGTHVGADDAAEPVAEGWPSVREILAPVQSPSRRPATSATAHKRSSGPALSDPIAPATWSLPAWAVLVPATLLVLAIGAVGGKLAWTWGQDDRAAGLLADHLLRHGETESPAPIEVPEGTPPATWWASTPSHLHLRARAERSNAGRPESREAVDFLLHAAHNAAPLDSAVRLAMATESDGDAGSEHDPLGSLGLSNDAPSHRQTGRGLLAAGKVEAGLSAYRQAIEIALSTELERAGMPPSLDDAEFHRFLLPREDAVGDLVRDLAERAPGGYGTWSKAIPDSPVAALAVYRWLHRRHQPEEDQAFDRLAALPESADPTAEAIRLASRAEAEALRESYATAIQLYEEAVKAMPDDVIGRSWQFNLGEIARLSGDAKTMHEAWDAARGPSPHDVINVCLVKARGRAGLTGLRGAAGPDDAGSVVPAPFPVKVSR